MLIANTNAHCEWKEESLKCTLIAKANANAHCEWVLTEKFRDRNPQTKSQWDMQQSIYTASLELSTRKYCVA